MGSEVNITTMLERLTALLYIVVLSSLMYPLSCINKLNSFASQAFQDRFYKNTSERLIEK